MPVAVSTGLTDFQVIALAVLFLLLLIYIFRRLKTHLPKWSVMANLFLVEWNRGEGIQGAHSEGQGSCKKRIVEMLCPLATLSWETFHNWGMDKLHQHLGKMPPLPTLKVGGRNRPQPHPPFHLA